MKYLIVNGDDLGMTPGVSAGILEAHINGILTSASMLVTTLFSEPAAAAARAHPELSVGLHVCLTHESGRMTTDPDDRRACRAALVRQFERFVDLMGAPPSHLDSHHHVHRDGRLLPLFRELAAEHSIPLREHSGVRYFSAFYGQWGGTRHLEQIDVPALRSMLRVEIGEGFTELGCHPGHVDSVLESSYASERETELRTLCAGPVRSTLQECELQLVNYRDAVRTMAC